jgi:hypothetical protein
MAESASTGSRPAVSKTAQKKKVAGNHEIFFSTYLARSSLF